MSILKDKQYLRYEKVSRYTPFPVYYNSADLKYTGGITNHLETQDVPFVAHTVKQGDTLDTLSLHYYNNPTYFWVIADFNRISDAFMPLEVGTVLRIPTFSMIKFRR